MSEEKQINFEEQLKKLDDIVNSLQDKAMPLDESIKLYESGIQIIKDLEKILKESADKVEKVVTI